MGYHALQDEGPDRTKDVMLADFGERQIRLNPGALALARWEGEGGATGAALEADDCLDDVYPAGRHAPEQCA